MEQIFAEKNELKLLNGNLINYDYLVIATGAVKDYEAISGFEEHAYSVCDDEHAPKMWDAINNFKGGNVVIGASKTKWDEKSTEIKLDAPCEGPIGEIMFMLDFFLRERDLREITTITVFTPGKVFFDDVGPRIHEKVGSVISKKEIKVITEKVLKTIEEKSVIFEDGTQLPSDLTLVIPPYTGPEVIKNSGLGDQYGFIKTDLEMRHPQHHNIFVVGDCNTLSMPKLGHIAVLQADVAVSSLMKEIRMEMKKNIENAMRRNVKVIFVTPPNKRVPQNAQIFRKEGLIATDVVADRSRALLAGPDLNACGYTDNPALALHVFQFVQMIIDSSDFNAKEE